jgi:hypothetical protein
LLVTVADRVPQVDYVKTCRVESKDTGASDQDFGACQRDEEAARDKLSKQWATYSSTDKANCVSSATAGYLPSYVELVTCLEMYQFLKQSRTGKTDLGVSTMPSNDSASAPPRRRNRQR